MRVHKVTLAALAVAASLSLTACQSDDDSAGGSGPSTAAAASSAGGGSGSAGSDQGGTPGSAEGSSGGTGTGGSASSGKGSAGQGTTGSGSDSGSGSGSGQSGKCRTDDLKITARDTTIGGDPDGTVTVQLTNRGSRSCTLSGYAGVDLKTNAGSLSARRTGKSTGPDVLKAGQTTYFGVYYPINKSGGSGVRVTGLLVTPPNETKTVTLPWPGGASLPVTEGGGSQVKVGPMGGEGQGG